MRVETKDIKGYLNAFGYDHIFGLFYEKYDYDEVTLLEAITSIQGLTFESLIDKIDEILKTFNKNDREEILDKLRRNVN